MPAKAVHPASAFCTQVNVTNIMMSCCSNASRVPKVFLLLTFGATFVVCVLQLLISLLFFLILIFCFLLNFFLLLFLLLILVFFTLIIFKVFFCFIILNFLNQLKILAV